MRIPPSGYPTRKPFGGFDWFIIAFFVFIVIGGSIALWSDASSSDSTQSTQPLRELSPQEYSQMTKAEYEWYLRNESGLTERGIELSLANFEFNQGQLLRWYERPAHLQTLDNFNANVARVNADGVTTVEEFFNQCTTYPQWEGKLIAVRDWVIEFREFDPETVELNHLGDMQTEAERSLDLVAKTKATCREEGFE